MFNVSHWDNSKKSCQSLSGKVNAGFATKTFTLKYYVTPCH